MMSQLIVAYHDTEEVAKKHGEDLKTYFGYEYEVEFDESSSSWKMTARTDKNLMG